MVNLLYVTCKNEAEAKKIAEKLLKAKLIACANIIPKIKSLYLWKGKIAKSSEALMLCKTKEDLVELAIHRIKELHSYDVPCISAIEITKENDDYLKWLEEVLVK